ncbi:MAG: hypothetical protein QXI60_07980 [Thermofilaceae archaeon]
MKAAAKAAASASIVLWLLAIGLLIMLGSSASLVKVSSEGVGVSLSPAERAIIITFKITISNGGFLDLTPVNLTAAVIDTDGEVLTERCESIDAIRAGSSHAFNMILKLSVEDALKALFSNKALLLACRVDVGFAGLVKASAYTVTGLKTEAWLG